jgi:hypothetical protein
MSGNQASKQKSPKRGAAIGSLFIALVAILFFSIRPARRLVRESLMQRVSSAHYEILCPRDALSQEAMTQFANQRESLFTLIDTKLRDAGANSHIRVIFDPAFAAPRAEATGLASYSVTGTTIRAKLNGQKLDLDPAADAEALLHVAWGKPGNLQVVHWVAIALIGEWRGEDIGMAAAGTEQKLGTTKVSSLLNLRSAEISSPEDRDLLGAAWISEVVDLGGPAEVRKLYSAKAKDFDEAEAAKVLGTTPGELERQWQLWVDSYLAGMPSASQAMPMKMPEK